MKRISSLNSGVTLLTEPLSLEETDTPGVFVARAMSAVQAEQEREQLIRMEPDWLRTIDGWLIQDDSALFNRIIEESRKSFRGKKLRIVVLVQPCREFARLSEARLAVWPNVVNLLDKPEGWETASEAEQWALYHRASNQLR
jgi:hypothetical protein